VLKPFAWKENVYGYYKCKKELLFLQKDNLHKFEIFKKMSVKTKVPILTKVYL